MMKTLLSVLFSGFLLTACGHNTQTTSGTSYLAKYQDVQATTPLEHDEEISIEEQIRQVAAVEPVLTFPARIGLARIENGHLSAVPGKEADAWGKALDQLGQEFGAFIPLSPLVVELVTKSVESQYKAPIHDVMHKIRLGAARQHFDAVLIYEVYSRTGRNMNALAVTDLTIIGGYLLPSRALEAEGFANAMLIDVIQGYPYGTADVTLTKDEFATLWGAENRQRDLSKKVKTEAAIKLTGEVQKMLERLYVELTEKREKKDVAVSSGSAE